jgi:putative spermidine/putrescine transport system ATP-binding protein
VSAAGLAVEGVSFAYAGAPAVREVSLAVPAGSLLALLGPSGCGKSTLLKIVGGYLAPERGRVLLRGRDVTALPPEARNAGTVFQNYALFPHLSARRNVAFGLEVRGVPRAERDRAVSATLARVGLSAAEADRKPAQLSGGQQQRVAVARALAFGPDVLLLDEPLANLDRHLREHLRGELRALQRATGVTALLVTHDQEEALAVADAVAVMGAGRVLQVGPPEDVYERPQTPFVARFLGAANVLAGARVGRPGAVVLLRPERCTVNAPVAPRWAWEGRVTAVAYLGAGALVDVACASGLHVRARVPAGCAVRAGDTVTVGASDEHLWTIPDADPPELSAAGAAAAPPATAPRA